jgi:putative acetyltransferase
MIRKYTQEEIPTLLVIWGKAAKLAHPFLSNDFHEMVKGAMKDMYLPNSDTWVYEESGVIIGFISMAGNEIGGLFVDPKKHAKGIGTSLMNHMREFHTELEVEVFEENKIGKPFYEKNGFKIIKEYVMKETGKKVLRMRK